MRHRFRLGASPLLRFTLQVFRQLEAMARTLGNGQKSCDDYGFIQCVKRLFPTLQTERGGGGRAGGIVAFPACGHGSDDSVICHALMSSAPVYGEEDSCRDRIKLREGKI